MFPGLEFTTTGRELETGKLRTITDTKTQHKISLALIIHQSRLRHVCWEILALQNKTKIQMKKYTLRPLNTLSFLSLYPDNADTVIFEGDNFED